MPCPSQDIIAWLVPASNNPAAEKTLAMAANAPYLFPCADSPHLTSRIRRSLLASGPPRHALALTFTRLPPKNRRHGRFVLGTDPRRCDIVLPALPGIASQHCSLGFDGLCRLTLEDASATGTQVWYDWDCAGDQRDYSWVLSGGNHTDGGVFPSNVRCITVDIQGVRFQIIVNDHQDRVAFAQKVDALYTHAEEEEELEPAAAQIDALWAEPPQCKSPLERLRFSALPVLRHIVVKSLGGGGTEEEEEQRDQVYVWDMERPWEPMVKASA